MAQCPLRKPNNKQKITNSFQDSMLLIESYMPQSDEMSGKIDELLGGMRETLQNEGIMKHFS